MATREPAPGSLRLIQEFVNTRDIYERTDELASPDALGEWLAAHGLLASRRRLPGSDLQRAIAFREALRALLLANHDREPPAQGALEVLNRSRGTLAVRFDAGGRPYLHPVPDGVDAALATLLASVHEAEVAGTWERLKACRLDDCQWAFYDSSRNHSGNWCSMAVCGNRAKARKYRQRSKARRDPGSPPRTRPPAQPAG